jgi:hypothetical protein
MSYVRGFAKRCAWTNDRTVTGPPGSSDWQRLQVLQKRKRKVPRVKSKITGTSLTRLRRGLRRSIRMRSECTAAV